MSTAPMPRVAPTAFPDLGYGTRARVGMIIPSVNIAAERQIPAMLPPNVTLHVTRGRLRETSEAAVREMTADVEGGARVLADAGPGVILFHCTAATTFAPGDDDAIIARIRSVADLPAGTTSKALVAALDALDARRVALITPYAADINHREVAFLEAQGREVVHEFGLGLVGGPEMFAVTPEDWYDLALAQADPAADVYFLSCAATRTAEVIAPLEAALGRPVLTSNQLAAWYGARLAGIDTPVAGFGSLFARALPR